MDNRISAPAVACAVACAVAAGVVGWVLGAAGVVAALVTALVIGELYLVRRAVVVGRGQAPRPTSKWRS